MSVALALAASSVTDSAVRFAASAAEAVHASIFASGKDNNLASALAGMNMASADFKASVAVLKTTDKMMGALLDITA
ncbi:MAG: flagellar hook protein FlgE [Alphaproteobacteria bacterium]|nr:flagellar hook protein FlgE [Alphaproteobacteria bacterium]